MSKTNLIKQSAKFNNYYTVSVNISKHHLNKIRDLVTLGVVANVSEFIRAAVTEKLQKVDITTLEALAVLSGRETQQQEGDQ